MKISFLILAKSDSKRLPNKNILDYKGKPMFVWNLEKCLKFGKTYVSSDSDEILEIAKRYKAIPIKRPKELCGNTPNIPVYQHAIKFMKDIDGFIAVQANSPDIKEKLIKKTKNAFEMGFMEVMTIHQDKSIYGSVWAMTIDRLNNYGDPYNPKPEFTIVDYSEDIHYEQDLYNS